MATFDISPMREMIKKLTSAIGELQKPGADNKNILSNLEKSFDTITKDAKSVAKKSAAKQETLIKLVNANKDFTNTNNGFVKIYDKLRRTIGKQKKSLEALEKRIPATKSTIKKIDELRVAISKEGEAIEILEKKIAENESTLEILKKKITEYELFDEQELFFETLENRITENVLFLKKSECQWNENIR